MKDNAIARNTANSGLTILQHKIGFLHGTFLAIMLDLYHFNRKERFRHVNKIQEGMFDSILYDDFWEIGMADLTE